MPKLDYIDAIFPDEPNKTFTVDEITQRLICRYSRAVNDDRVRRALLALKASAVTAPIVAPVGDSFPRVYSTEAARRITRRLGAPDRDILRRSKLPIVSELLAALEANETKSRQIANRPQLKRKSA